MKTGSFPIYIGVLLATPPCAIAYEQTTHQWITEAAVTRSLIGDPAFVEGIGVDPVLPGPKAGRRSVSALVVEGAVDEDDVPRPLHHFFDPQNGGRPLTVGTTLGKSSPDWALEPEPVQGQEFSLRDAQQFYYRAMTSRKTERQVQFGLLFHALGRAVHHIQDMAQPQHTRNDQHLPLRFKSAYEAYSLRQLGREALRAMPDYGPVDLHVFDTARKFWQNAGKGMAEFSSANFVSARTNFLASGTGFSPYPEQPLPAPNACAGVPLVTFHDVRSPDLFGPTWKWGGKMGFIATPVIDANKAGTAAGLACNLRTSTFSVFNEVPIPVGGEPITSLNRLNFDAAHAYLIPRSISYSAGLIDYFFRGRLFVSASAIGNSATVTLRNATVGDFSLSASSRPGASTDFEIWYDALGGARKRIEITSGATLSSTVIAPGGLRALQFVLPTDVDTASAKPFAVVFRGTLGREEGVIGQVFSLSVGSLVVTPNYVPSDGVAGRRVLRTSGSGWEAEPRTGSMAPPMAGNVDWRGWRAEDLVTWNGPSSRYWGSGTGQHIFYGGNVIAMAPNGAAVQGASIRYEAGARTLNVATLENSQLTLYSRPFLSGYSNDDLYNATTNPLGWRRVAATAASGAIQSPAFFNASGTEVQMLTCERRVKLSVTGAASSTSTRGSVRHNQYVSRSLNVDATGNDSCSWPYTGTCAQTVTCSINDIPSPICALSRYNAGSISNESNKNEIVLVEQTEGIVCVDYRGDAEVLCRYTNDYNTVSEDTRRIVEAANYTTQFSCSGSNSWGGSATTTDRRNGRTRNQTGFRLSFGAVSIVTNGSVYEVTEVTNASVNGIPPPLSTGSTAYDIDMKTTLEDNHVFYADARRDLIVYMANTQVDRLTARGSVATSVNTVDGASSTRVSANRTNVVRHDLIVDYRGRRQVYDTKTEETSSADVSVPVVLATLNASTCDSAFSDGGLYTSFSSVIDPAVFAVESVLSSNRTGVAVDSTGQLAISVPLAVRNSPYATSPTRIGTYNYLSNGSFATLLPSARDEPSYSPIGLLR